MIQFYNYLFVMLHHLHPLFDFSVLLEINIFKEVLEIDHYIIYSKLGIHKRVGLSSINLN